MLNVPSQVLIFLGRRRSNHASVPTWPLRNFPILSSSWSFLRSEERTERTHARRSQYSRNTTNHNVCTSYSATLTRGCRLTIVIWHLGRPRFLSPVSPPARSAIVLTDAEAAARRRGPKRVWTPRVFLLYVIRPAPTRRTAVFPSVLSERGDPTQSGAFLQVTDEARSCFAELLLVPRPSPFFLLPFLRP